ncbi:MAG: response regulator [Planctomycetaceae bacterium]|nr:response regulator [Planctomycetaceae bacterium]
MRALVIDDSAVIRTVLTRILTGMGFEVVTAGHGKEALERLSDGRHFDIALVDWNMPEMNGYEFIKSVRASVDWRDLPLMMVTTETEMEQVVRALAAGANEYLMKPFTAEMVQEKLQILGITGS